MRVRISALVAASVLMSAATSGISVAQATHSALGAAQRCRSGSRLLRGAAGSGLGAFLGMVAAKIKMSDWNDATRTSSASRTFNDITLASAVAGAVIGSFALVPCPAPNVASPAEHQDSWRRPITREEMTEAGIDGTVYDAVFQLRRNWLNARGGVLGVEVYLDEFPAGDVAALRNIAVAGVSGLRYYDAAEATFRWGGDHAQGVIQVFTVRDPTSP